MGKRPFSKEAKAIPEQVEILRSRGMEVANPAAAEHFLRHINYYRLRAYWLPSEEDRSTHRFRSGTTIESVVDLYNFDRDLRLLVFDAIERVEVSIRSVCAYEMSIAYGPHGHLDKSIVRNASRHQNFLDKLKKEIDASKEVFIEHFRSTYEELTPPMWASCEVMTIGLLSKWYENLAPMRLRSRIASQYGLNESVLESWCTHLAYTRNTCAHHSRLWNRQLTITPALPKKKIDTLHGAFVNDSRKLYNTLVILLYLMDIVSPGHTWRVRLITLLSSRSIRLSAMGFPSDWQARRIWSNRT